MSRYHKYTCLVVNTRLLSCCRDARNNTHDDSQTTGPGSLKSPIKSAQFFPSYSLHANICRTDHADPSTSHLRGETNTLTNRKNVEISLTGRYFKYLKTSISLQVDHLLLCEIIPHGTSPPRGTRRRACIGSISAARATQDWR